MAQILLVSLLSGLATTLGGLLVLRIGKLTRHGLAFFLALAAGIMLAVVCADLIPASYAGGGANAVLYGVTAGWLFMMVMRRCVTAVLRRSPLAKGASFHYLRLGWFIAVVTALHDIPEGLAIGAGDMLHPELGMLLALAIGLHNLPEGMSIAVPLRMAGIPGKKILGIITLAAFFTPLGTLVGILLFEVSPQLISMSMGFAAGAMGYVVARDLWPEAWHSSKLITAGGTILGAALLLIAGHLHLHG
ncbi:ZIP family zinc transporter [Tumebacillus sp. BK434]|uniref:ZIP family metal transporter n=1 Tax=Tumebacillus sp. BK434 TaxID=2512169 RepID=UPI00104C0A8A|nr:ZIP family metal transporter [Tumebacillus sp. BK434]TCP57721.1 ZIP family zinc transporter [Tumebacillus sp. BK434]